MPWFKVDDTLHGHPKSRRAGLHAMGLWAVAGSYASQYATDGFVPEWFAAAWPHGRRLAGALVRAGLWDCSERDGERGWQFHDWPHYQPTREEVEEDRAANRERQRRFREKRRESRRNGVTNAVSNGTPSRPDPTRPRTTSSSLEELTSGGGSEDGSPSPNRRSGDVLRLAPFGLGGVPR